MAYWKSLPIITTGGCRFECSNCGYHINRCDYDPLPDQCPNCGKDMGDIASKINQRKDETATTTENIGTVILPKYGTNGWQKEETTPPPPSTGSSVNDVPKMTGGMVGWTCPVCGRGLSPFTQFCPCKGYPQFDVTC